MRRKLEAVALHALVIWAAILTAAPLLWMVSASFMRSGAATSSPPPLLPAAHTASLEHYRALFTSQSLGRYLLNSLLIAGGGPRWPATASPSCGSRGAIAYSGIWCC